jgi:AcrR family transcriptional regulator
MARPFTASDDDILHAARKVIGRRGPDGFSIAEVATEVGLSRAAIILRFKSTHALKLASLEKMVEQFAAVLEALPTTPSGDNLLHVAAFIGTYMHSRESSVRFFANYYGSNVQDRDLLRLEHRRGAVLDQAIKRVMPETVLDPDSAVIAFRAHLTGSITTWLSLDDSNSRRYLVMRTKEWLKLSRIPFSERVADELSESKAEVRPTEAPRLKQKRSTGVRGAKRSRPRLKAV